MASKLSQMSDPSCVGCHIGSQFSRLTRFDLNSISFVFSSFSGVAYKVSFPVLPGNDSYVTIRSLPRSDISSGFTEPLDFGDIRVKSRSKKTN